MHTLNSTPTNKPTKWSNQPGPISWQTVPDFIQKTLSTQGCTLLKYSRERPQLAHIRFQYVSFAYQGDLYYLQRWSDHEWGVSPSQIIFPADGVCPLKTLSNGSLLSSLVKKSVARFFGHFPDNSPFQPSPSTSRHTKSTVLPLAG